MDAAYYGSVGAVRILLAAGADTGAIDDDGCGAPFLNCNGYHGADLEARWQEIDAMLMAPRETWQTPAAAATAATLGTADAPASASNP
jgi:hypothetical protein